MLHDNILGNSDKSGPLINYLGRSTKVRQDNKMLAYDNTLRTEPSTWLTPTLEEFSNKLVKVSKRNEYHDKMETIIKTKQVPEANNLFENIAISIGWMQMGLDDLQKAIEIIPTILEQYIRNKNEILIQSSVDISSEIKELKDLRINLLNDQNYKNLLDQCEERKTYMKEVNNIYRELIFAFRSQNVGPVSRNIETNPVFSDLNRVVKEMEIKYPEMTDSKKPLMDISSLAAYIDNANEIILRTFHKVRDAGITFTMADSYMNKVKNESTQKSITEFLQDKSSEFESGIEYRELPIEAGKYQKLFVFKDYSMVVQKSSGEYIDIFNNNEAKALHKELITELVKDEFKKNPQIAKGLVNLAKSVDDIGLSSFKNAMETYKNNADILKLYEMDISKTYKNMDKEEFEHNSYRTFEAIDDLFHKTIKDHKVKQYAHSISSNKYEHLYNDDTYKIIANLYDMNLKKEIFQQNIGKKMAAYKSPEEFNVALKQFYGSLNEFSNEATLSKANNAGIEIVVENDDLVILRIKSFEESKLMGSSSWCIAREQSYFNSYTSGTKEQYFVFDYTREAEDNSSMIGITIDKGRYYTAHYKDDDQAEEDAEMIDEYITMINSANKLTNKKEVTNKNTMSI